MPVSGSFLPTLLVVALAVVLSTPPSAASFGVRLAGVPDVTLSFPLFSGENESLQLADYIAQRLTLGQAEASRVSTYNVSEVLYDGIVGLYPVSNRLDTFGDRGIPQHIVDVPSTGGFTIQLHYNASAEPNGTFLLAEVLPFPVASFNQASIRTLLLDAASFLGIAMDGTEVFQNWSNADQRTTTLYRPLNGLPVEFGNQLSFFYTTSNLSDTRLRLFPWMQTVPTPTLSSSEAFLSGLSYINRTYNVTHFTYSFSLVQFALDSFEYRLAYSVRAVYVGQPWSYYGELNYVVWIDAVTGTALFSGIVGGTIPSASPPLTSTVPLSLLALVVVLCAAALLVVSLIRADEGARFAVFTLLAFPFFRLRRERALEHFVRGQIYEHLRSHPGATYSDIRDQFSLTNGTAAYHLMVLEKMGFVVSKREGRMKYFFRADAPQRVVEQVLSPLQYDILDALAKRNQTQAQLAEALRATRQRIAYNVRALQRRGMVSRATRRESVGITESGRAKLSSRPLLSARAEERASGGG